MADETKSCPECAEPIKAQALLCRYCKYDFRTRTSGRVAPPARIAPARRSGFPVWAILLLVGALVICPVALIAGIAIPALLQARRAGGERMATAILKTLSTAQTDFRANDRDGNGVNDYWTGDVAGLYCMTHAGTPGSDDEMIRLIDLSTATADAAPLEEGAADGEYRPLDAFFSPKVGYYVQAMTHDAEGEPYARDTDEKMGPVHNEFSYGICAFPSAYGSSGTWTYIVNQDNTIYKTNNGGEAVLEWPSEQDLRINWDRLD